MTNVQFLCSHLLEISIFKMGSFSMYSMTTELLFGLIILELIKCSGPGGSLNFVRGKLRSLHAIFFIILVDVVTATERRMLQLTESKHAEFLCYSFFMRLHKRSNISFLRWLTSLREFLSINSILRN